MIGQVSPFLTQHDLECYCRSNWSAIHKEKLGNPGGPPKAAAKMGFDIYTRSQSRDMDIMVIGPNRIREDNDLINNVGAVLGDVSKKRLEKLENDNLSHLYQGAVLGEKKWSGFINDLFMLGGVHARKTFHFSIENGRFLNKEDVWDATKDCLNTTGRELLLLKMAGYSRVHTKDKATKLLGHVFVPPPKDDMHSITLEEYRSSIYKVKTPGEVLELFNRTIEYSTYPCSLEIKAG